MLRPVTLEEAAEYIFSDKKASWTWNGAYELAEMYEREEDDDTVIDRIWLRMCFKEYPTAVIAAEDLIPNFNSNNEDIAMETLEQSYEWIFSYPTGVIVKVK